MNVSLPVTMDVNELRGRLFVNRTADLATLVSCIWITNNAGESAQKEIAYSALSHGSGKTWIGKQCLKQFHLQENEIKRHLREYQNFSEEKLGAAIDIAKGMYLCYVSLKGRHGDYEPHHVASLIMYTALKEAMYFDPVSQE